MLDPDVANGHYKRKVNDSDLLPSLTCSCHHHSAFYLPADYSQCTVSVQKVILNRCEPYRTVKSALSNLIWYFFSTGSLFMLTCIVPGSLLNMSIEFECSQPFKRGFISIENSLKYPHLTACRGFKNQICSYTWLLKWYTNVHVPVLGTRLCGHK